MTVKDFFAKNKDIGTTMIKAPNGQIGYWTSRGAYNRHGEHSIWLYDEDGNDIEEEDLIDEFPKDYEGLLPEEIPHSTNWKIATKEEIEEYFPHLAYYKQNQK